jgi:hypothetical protein
LLTLREVMIVDGRYRGWIDIVEFDPLTGTLFIIELKTRLDDVGAIERQVGWYERHARAIAEEHDWTVQRTMSALVVLATDENERAIRIHRDFFDRAFPVRHDLLRGVHADATRGLAADRPTEPAPRLAHAAGRRWSGRRPGSMTTPMRRRDSLAPDERRNRATL